VHYEIAATSATPIHVLAGPGTGKTFAMMRRVARLLEEQVSPADLLAVSFTRTAARDLNEQLNRLSVPGATMVHAGTLHSLCFSFLARSSVFDITHRVPRPLLGYEEEFLIIDLAAEYGGKRNVRRLISAYEAAWARLQTDDPGGPASDIDVAFHGNVLDWLRYHKSILIGELVPLTLRFIRQNPAFAEMPTYAHVLVDEYQDLNRAEQQLIDALAGDQSYLVIGDDCQSIYSFRHANPEGIREFPQTHANTLPLTITECKRCPRNIVAMSNALISHESRRTRRVPLVADPSKPDAHVFIVQHDHIDAEVEACAAFVAHHIRSRKGFPAGQVLVLTPRRFLGNRIRDALIARGLNSLSYFAEDPLDNASSASGFCLLTLLVDPQDRAALRAWIGMGSSTGLTGGYRQVRLAAEELQQEPADVLRALEAGTQSLRRTSAVVRRWRDLQQRLADLQGKAGLELVRAIWPQDTDEADDIRLMAEAIAVRIEDPRKLLEELREDVTQPYLPDSQSDVVRVMSLHKSKGLTAGLVVVAGCMEGALPRVDADLPPAAQDAQYEEQRRLFYVAITRATDTLVISSATALPLADAYRSQVTIRRRRMIGGEPVAVTTASPFISELGAAAPPVIRGSDWRARVGF
jgi:superfamily I DNA/RNA helicase